MFLCSTGDFISHWRASEDYDDQTFAEYSGQNVNIYERGVYLIYSQVSIHMPDYMNVMNNLYCV